MFDKSFRRIAGIARLLRQTLKARKQLLFSINACFFTLAKSREIKSNETSGLMLELYRMIRAFVL